MHNTKCLLLSTPIKLTIEVTFARKLHSERSNEMKVYSTCDVLGRLAGLHQGFRSSGFCNKINIFVCLFPSLFLFQLSLAFLSPLLIFSLHPSFFSNFPLFPFSPFAFPPFLLSQFSPSSLSRSYSFSFPFSLTLFVPSSLFSFFVFYFPLYFSLFLSTSIPLSLSFLPFSRFFFLSTLTLTLTFTLTLLDFTIVQSNVIDNCGLPVC